MSLKQWDRKFDVLSFEIERLCQFNKIKEDSEAKKISSLQEKLPKIQKDIEKNLAYILTFSNRKNFLSINEKAGLHWAKKYALKAQAHYKNYFQSLIEVFWANLVHLRGESLAIDKKQSLLNSKMKKKSSSHQKDLMFVKRKLEKQSEMLHLKKQELEKEYLTLALSKMNREALVSATRNKIYEKGIKSKIGTNNKSEHIPAIKIDGKKQYVTNLSELISDHVLVNKKQGASSLNTKGSNANLNDLLKDFDHLHLDEGLRGPRREKQY